MTNAEILDAFETFVGDALDTTLQVALANMAKGRLEAELKLEITKKLYTSLSSTVGGTYTTQYALPNDILVPTGGVIYVGTTPRKAIPLEHREAFKNSPSHYYVDLRQSKFHLTGSIATAETITFPYIYTTAEIDDTSDTDVVWPSRFHLLIPMEMAKVWYAQDAGEKGRSWLPEWDVLYKTLKAGLVDWDTAWKLNAIGNSTPYGNEGEYEVPLSMM